MSKVLEAKVALITGLGQGMSMRWQKGVQRLRSPEELCRKVKPHAMKLSPHAETATVALLVVNHFVPISRTARYRDRGDKNQAGNFLCLLAAPPNRN